MSTAFSASLFGLAGSLVLGFLDLQAGLAQNRFYNELEEMAVGLHAAFGRRRRAVEMGEASVPAYIQALLEQTADSLDNLQRILSRGEESRIAANAPLHRADRAPDHADRPDARRADAAAAARRAAGRAAAGAAAARRRRAASRRSARKRARICATSRHYLARMSEDMTQGRGELVQEMRSEIRLLARTIAALAEEAERS